MVGHGTSVFFSLQFSQLAGFLAPKLRKVIYSDSEVAFIIVTVHLAQWDFFFFFNNLYFKKPLFIYWLFRVFVGCVLVVESRDCPPFVVHRLLIAAASLVAEHRLSAHMPQ